MKQINFVFDRRLSPPPATEVPPVSLDDRRTFFTTSYTWSCLTHWARSDTSIPVRDCSYVQYPETRPTPNEGYIAPDQLDKSHMPWRRDYSGILSAHVVPDSIYSSQVIAIIHGENKNELVDGNYYQNTVDKQVSASTCYSGIHDGAYKDCDQAYNGFISLSAAPLSLQQLSVAEDHYVDYGPILWPSAGYTRADGSKITSGVKVPSSILKDGYIYVFYLDGGTWGSNDIPGRKKGIKVARAHLSKTGAPSGFVPYYDGRFDPANPSLPDRFDISKIATRSTPCKAAGRIRFSRTAAISIRFSVAHIAGTGLYMPASRSTATIQSPDPRPANFA